MEKGTVKPQVKGHARETNQDRQPKKTRESKIDKERYACAHMLI